jgi:hypothetical protein
VATETSAKDVARWMADEVRRRRFFDQADAATEIAKRFGDAFIRTNDQGGESIDTKVLKEFRKLTEADVVWDRGELQWRLRESGDAPGRQQE